MVLGDPSDVDLLPGGGRELVEIACEPGDQIAAGRRVDGERSPCGKVLELEAVGSGAGVIAEDGECVSAVS